MIDLGTQNPVLAAFAADLDGQSPWDLADSRPDLSRASHDDIEAAQIVWANRVLAEYRGVLVFTELLAVLTEAEAPYPALAAVHRIIGDELRHTHLCATVVHWLGGWDAFNIDLSGQRMPRGEGPPAGRALETIARELGVMKADSVRTLEAHLRATEDKAIRDVLSVLVADEQRHAKAGRALEALVRSHYPKDDLQRAEARLAAHLDEERKHLRSEALAAAQGGPGRALGASLRREDLERV